MVWCAFSLAVSAGASACIWHLAFGRRETTEASSFDSSDPSSSHHCPRTNQPPRHFVVSILVIIPLVPAVLPVPFFRLLRGPTPPPSSTPAGEETCGRQIHGYKGRVIARHRPSQPVTARRSCSRSVTDAAARGIRRFVLQQGSVFLFGVARPRRRLTAGSKERHNTTTDLTTSPIS